MKVVNLVAWAGPDFSYVPGDIVELPTAMAKARIAAGVAAPVMNGGGKNDSEEKDSE